MGFTFLKFHKSSISLQLFFNPVIIHSLLKKIVLIGTIGHLLNKLTIILITLLEILSTSITLMMECQHSLGNFAEIFTVIVSYRQIWNHWDTSSCN